MAFEAVTIILFCLALPTLLLLANYVRTKNGKPPHPPSWPIIGHLHLLRKKKPIHRILASLSQRHGPIMYLQLGFRPVLVISSSELAKECFTANDKALASRPRTAAAKHLGYDHKMFSVLPYNSQLRDLRKICTMKLFSASRIDSFKHLRTEEVSALICSLFESCQREAAPVNMKSRLSDLTSNIIMRMVASKRVSGPQGSEDLQEGHHLRKMGLISAMKKLQKKRDAFMQKLVNEHREKQGMHAQDLIDLLISAVDNQEIQSDNNDDVIKATALNMINAGTDTSSVTIEWALAALLQRPDILGKAQEELDKQIGRDRVVEESDLQELTYLQAIVKETLRLYPAGPLLVPHEAAEACSIGGFCVPAGTRLLVNAWAIHRDPALWSCPTEFDPEKFLNSGKAIDVKGHDFELIPFGSGRRMCPGMSLALVVIHYTLARLLQSFEWRVPEGAVIDMAEGLGLTMPKAIPLEAIVKPRLPLHLY
ncbi:xanthotoxin 5-hydroxylase CYP82C4 isoform X2 [Cryptomeria japonica]|uniref:xanthotoxin 5-hydroxylase CYP82C4 isoform X2 n=1 Tax=Cryptomeria japonica TaxID=3369 RepID=UPI0027DA5805|nr:xanthotoxin 5-hydroxylase CYP82C4 isoform X2 [Cryptomeria japonica]